MQARRGFTLAEILLTLAIGLIIFSLGIIASINFVEKREVEITAETLVSYLRTAEDRAMAGEGNIDHGVSTADSKITLFRGASYATRQTAYDTVLAYPSYVHFSGLSQVVFSKQTGTPSATGTITLTGSSRTIVITIYSTGAISR